VNARKGKDSDSANGLISVPVVAERNYGFIVPVAASMFVLRL
jgi:hypothetical protein